MVNVPSQYDPLVREMSQSTGIPYGIIAAQAFVESGFSAAQAGVGQGTEFNPADEAKVYDIFMGDLLKQEQGNVRNALAAYNAGPGNIQAGMGYADKILGLANNPNPPPVVPTTGFPGIPGLPSLSISGILGNLFGDLRDILERLGLILLGAALILLGIHILSGGGSTNVNVAAPEQGTKSKAKEAGKNVAKDAAEDAVVA